MTSVKVTTGFGCQSQDIVNKYLTKGNLVDTELALQNNTKKLWKDSIQNISKETVAVKMSLQSHETA